jgi:hypothetical protein
MATDTAKSGQAGANAAAGAAAAAADVDQADVVDLAGLGTIPEDYQHHQKLVVPSDGLALPGGYLKWYDIHRAETPVPADTREQARDFLRTEAGSGRLDLRDELGFVILHRCGESFYFLIACSWRNHNELWQTVYGRDGDDPFEFVARPEDHMPMQCVWEMGATCHERSAWSRFLRSTRDDDAKRAYLTDRFDGSA